MSPQTTKTSDDDDDDDDDDGDDDDDTSQDATTPRETQFQVTTRPACHDEDHDAVATVGEDGL